MNFQADSLSRLSEFLLKANIKWSDLYEKTGLVESTISSIRTRKSGMHEKHLIPISQAYPKLNLHWVITGQGEMLLPEHAGGAQQINNGIVGQSQILNQISVTTQLQEKDIIIAELKTEIKMLREFLALNNNSGKSER